MMTDGSIDTLPDGGLRPGSTYGIGDTNPILQGVVQGEGNTQRVLTWHQCPSDCTVLAFRWRSRLRLTVIRTTARTTSST